MHLSENTIINKYMTSEKRILFEDLYESSQDLNPNNIFDYFISVQYFNTYSSWKKALTKEKIVNLTKNLDNIIFVGGINIEYP